jgi:hypothetical protein
VGIIETKIRHLNGSDRLNLFNLNVRFIPADTLIATFWDRTGQLNASWAEASPRLAITTNRDDVPVDVSCVREAHAHAHDPPQKTSAHDKRGEPDEDWKSHPYRPHNAGRYGQPHQPQADDRSNKHQSRATRGDEEQANSPATELPKQTKTTDLPL